MRVKNVFAGAIVIVLALAVVGCGLFVKAAATVNGEKIPITDVNKQMDRIAAQHQTAQQKQAFVKQKKQIEKQILDILIEQTLYKQQAEKMGIKVTSAQVDAEVNRTKKRFPSEAEFNKALKSAQMTMDDLKEFTLNRLIADAVNKKIVGKVSVTEAEMKDYYEKNKDQFKQPEQVKVSHILVKTEDEAKKILADIQGGADFAEEAKKFSTDPSSKTKGGDLGFVQKGMMAPEFDAAAFALGVGEVSQPVKTQFGWHIIKVFEKKDAAQKTYDEVKSSLEQMLKAQKESAKIRLWLDGIKKQSKIVTNI